MLSYIYIGVPKYNIVLKDFFCVLEGIDNMVHHNNALIIDLWLFFFLSFIEHS